MLSELNELFYADIDLKDWEGMAAKYLDEDETLLTDRLKNKIWWDACSLCGDYSDVNNFNNQYAEALLLEVCSKIRSEFEGIEVDMYLNCLNTSFHIGGEAVSDYGSLIDALSLHVGLDKLKDVMDELNDSEFNDLARDERELIQIEGVVGDMRSAVNLNTYFNDLDVTSGAVEAVVSSSENYYMSDCPTIIKQAVAVGLQVKRFIDENTKQVTTDVLLTDSEVYVEVTKQDGDTVMIESITDLWEVLSDCKG